ncbi:SIMPL domain-containing protein [Gallibacterium anatis]|uniref:SIMPL domain-containing protein n=1 Tax=Gallibacterium anatis TaxID=750 RepID=UPI0039FCA47A
MNKRALLGQIFLVAGMFFIGQVQADNSASTQLDTLTKVSYQVTTETVVKEDKVQVVLNTQIQTNKLTKKVNQTLEQRIEDLIPVLAQHYPALKVVGNQRNSYANYSNEGKVNGWTLAADITLESDDFSQVAMFISELPNDFRVKNTNFFVSTEMRKHQEAEMVKTLLALAQQQAEVIKTELHREQYHIININLNNSGYVAARAAPMRLAKAQEVENSLGFTPGETHLTMSADVVISLSEK